MTGNKKCILNRCEREQGIGTWVYVDGMDGAQPVCEDHWQALRTVTPMRVLAKIEAEVGV